MRVYIWLALVLIVLKIKEVRWFKQNKYNHYNFLVIHW